MIQENIQTLRKSIEESARRAGRHAQDIRFLLVTKTVPAERVKEALDQGVRDFGENRVQELLSKKKELGASVNWHMIGHLQTNKVKSLLQNVGADLCVRPALGDVGAHAGAPLLIHSLDRLKLAQEIDRQMNLWGHRTVSPKVCCLIQVNASQEQTQFGLAPDQVEGFVRSLEAFQSIDVQGLMTIGPHTEEEDKIRAAFRQVKKLQQELIKKFPKRTWDTLSMGMSGDYRIAVEEGATLLRIGSLVFGERK